MYIYCTSSCNSWNCLTGRHSTNHRPSLPSPSAQLERTPCWVVSLRPYGLCGPSVNKERPYLGGREARSFCLQESSGRQVQEVDRSHFSPVRRDGAFYSFTLLLSFYSNVLLPAFTYFIIYITKQFACAIVHTINYSNLDKI